MEILDENGDFIAWFSDDPDDWNSYSDYMRRIRRLVLEYNEVAFEVGAHLLGYNEKDSIEYVKLLTKVSTIFSQDEKLSAMLKEIRKWANYRLDSRHPDELDDPWLSRETQIAENSFNKAMKCWESGQIEEAIKNFEKAGLYDHPSGYKMLGSIFMDGLDVQSDIKKAIEYYTMGAEDGIADCAYTLGILYREGADRLSPDLDSAYKWIREAALLGYAKACDALGQLLENGWGCEKNFRKALYWYDVSITGIENGNRLRKIQEGTGLPVRLDGFNYKNAQYIDDVEWWRESYAKNGMLSE